MSEQKVAKPKKKRLPRTRMPEQPVQKRIKNFKEVALGYTELQALKEVSRCLSCKNPKCIEGCPVDIDIPEFVQLIRERKFIEAAQKIKKKNALPAICGRVCPQEIQCEELCLLSKTGEPIAIGRLERFVADYEAKHFSGSSTGGPTQRLVTTKDDLGIGAVARPAEGGVSDRPSDGQKVAIIGSGPAGLACASDLARLGYRVTIFEALHKPGGVLVYGIPEFRLPKKIVEREVEYVKSLGVEVRCDAVVGKLFTIDELMHEQGYGAVFIATGAGFPMFMKIPGENLNGVYSANEFLTRANLMKAYLFPKYDTPIRCGKSVAVVGGGNVAMDSARVALRLGADKVYLIYRRSEAEMPARREELEHAKHEGIIFQFLTNPTRILGKDGAVSAIECIKMELGEPDESGRRRPVPIKGSEFTIDVDTVIVAIGTAANPLIPRTTPDLELNRRGYIVADEETGRTSKEGVFAGGDIVTGAATVILAMGAGKKAARAIHQYLQEKAKTKVKT